jgi:hypothetical protein
VVVCVCVCVVCATVSCTYLQRYLNGAIEETHG